jgi:hypothetical protein
MKDEKSGTIYSWRVAILRYDINRVGNGVYHFDKAWNAPENETIRNAPPSCYFCPSAYGELSGETDYLMVTQRPQQQKGAGRMTPNSRDIIVVEVENSGVHWAEPRDLPFREMSFQVNDTNSERLCIRSKHPGGAHILRCDGTVEFLSDKTSAASVREMLSGAVLDQRVSCPRDQDPRDHAGDGNDR